MASTQLQISSVDFSELSKGVLTELWNDTNFHDVTLVCDGDQQVKAHKVVLASFSQFFKNILTKNPHQHPLIYIKGVNLEKLKVILDFIYSGEVTIDQDSLDSLLQLSKDLEIRGLFEGDSFMGNIAGQRENEERFVEQDIKGELVEIETEPNLTISESVDVADQEDKKPVGSKKDRYYPCDRCEYIATNSKFLKRHKSEAHKTHNEKGSGFDANHIMEEMSGIVTEPNRTISETAEVADQEDEKPNVITKERCYPCEECDYTATNNGVLYRHKRSDHKNQVFTCEQCNYTTNRDDSLLRHNRTKHS